MLERVIFIGSFLQLGQSFEEVLENLHEYGNRQRRQCWSEDVVYYEPFPNRAEDWV